MLDRSHPTAARWIGRILSALVVLAFLAEAAVRLFAPAILKPTWTQEGPWQVSGTSSRCRERPQSLLKSGGIAGAEPLFDYVRPVFAPSILGGYRNPFASL